MIPVRNRQLKITPYSLFYRNFEHNIHKRTIKKTKKAPAEAIHRGNFCQKKFAGKEIDPETRLYYFGARYLDPKTSRWLSGDPAVSEYIPSAPVNEEARKRNGNLPGIGGVFNYVNLHVYHYAGNNPVNYRDPDGMINVPIISSYTMNEQNSAWFNATVYNTNDLIREGGCALAAIANLATTLGFNYDLLTMNMPPYLNESGDVVWGNVATELGLTLGTQGTGTLPLAVYEANQNDEGNNYYTIAKVRYTTSDSPHWVGINGTYEENNRLYYMVSPTSDNDTLWEGSARDAQGWIIRNENIYVPADRIREYKIYSQPIIE